MSYNLNSLKGGYLGDYIRVIKGDTRSLDNGSHELWIKFRLGGTYKGLYRV